MKKPMIAIAFATAVASPALAAGIVIEVDNFTAHRGISQLVLRVTNTSDQDVSSVFIDCVFMTEDERAIDIGKALISHIPAGGTKFDKASIPTTSGVSKAACEVASFR